MAQIPRSVRLDAKAEERLLRAARRKGISASRLIREAVDRYCEQILGEDPLEAWNGYLGAAPDWQPPPAVHPASEFERHIAEKHESARRRKLP